MRNLFILLFTSIILISCESDDYFNIGVFHAKQKNYETAVAYFSKAIEKNPGDAEAYYLRAYCQQSIGGKEKQVISDYTKSLEYNPNDHEAYMNRGIEKTAIGQISEAIEDYEKSIAINPNEPVAYANLGNAYELKSDKEKACEHWNKALNLGYEKVRERIELKCK